MTGIIMLWMLWNTKEKKVHLEISPFTKDYVQRNINEQIKLVANEVTELNKCIITNNNENNSFGIEEWVSE